MRRLSEVVEGGSTETFFAAFEGFSSSDSEYKGTVGTHGFKIRKKKRFFDNSMTMAVATGKLRQKDEVLIVDAEINGFNKMFIPIFVIVVVVYAFMLVAIFTADTENVSFGFPFLLLHASFMMGIPYVIMRRSTSRMKYDLPRDLHYIASSKGKKF